MTCSEHRGSIGGSASRNMRHTRRQRRPEGRKGRVQGHASPVHETLSVSYQTEKQEPPLTLSYFTWKSTIFPVPKGSRKRNVIAAIIAQKKLVRGVRIKVICRT